MYQITVHIMNEVCWCVVVGAAPVLLALSVSVAVLFLFFLHIVRHIFSRRAPHLLFLLCFEIYCYERSSLSLAFIGV